MPKRSLPRETRLFRRERVCGAVTGLSIVVRQRSPGARKKHDGTSTLLDPLPYTASFFFT